MLFHKLQLELRFRRTFGINLFLNLVATIGCCSEGVCLCLCVGVCVPGNHSTKGGHVDFDTRQCDKKETNKTRLVTILSALATSGRRSVAQRLRVTLIGFCAGYTNTLVTFVKTRVVGAAAVNAISNCNPTKTSYGEL